MSVVIAQPRHEQFNIVLTNSDCTSEDIKGGMFKDRVFRFCIMLSLEPGVVVLVQGSYASVKTWAKAKSCFTVALLMGSGRKIAFSPAFYVKNPKAN